jgi:hypothetical protein
MFMDESEQFIIIPPEAIRAETELRMNEPHLTGVLVTVDLTKLDLEDGETYQLLARFGIDGRQPIKSMSPITVADL